MESFYTLFGRIHELNEELKTQVGIEHADISSKSTGLSADTFDLLITDSDLKSKMKKTISRRTPCPCGGGSI